jgi:hypothetical protein
VKNLRIFLGLSLFSLSVFTTTFPSGRASAQTKQGFVHTRGENLVDGSGQPLMLRGINLGNWFEVEGYMFHFDGGPQAPREIEDLTKNLLGPEKAEAFWKEWRANYITEADIDRIHAMGFNSVRVPLHWRFFTSDDAEGFKLVDQLVQWAQKDGIYVILDMHCAPGGQTGANIDDSWGIHGCTRARPRSKRRWRSGRGSRRATVRIRRYWGTTC